MTTKNEKLEELAKLEKEAKGGESISETQNEETFVQVEEEETAQSLIDALKMIKDNGFGLYTLDKELAARVYTPATTA